jgi:hypothetical protein
VIILKSKERLSQEDIKARLMFLIGSVLSFVFLVVTLGITYALIFVTQPIGGQAPNDAAFIDLLKTLAIFLTGSLGGVLASNGLKDKQYKSEYEKAMEKRFAGNDTPQSRRDS